jgi:shikimate dehydrogenase
VRHAAVLGSPIVHSLSPVLHRAAYRALGLTGWTYRRIECDAAGFAEFIDTAGPDWAGLSLTMPLKRIALTVADEVSPLAAAVGAANTLIWREGRRFVDNTDVYGIVQALREAGVDTVERSVIVGAGGTAQAALAALRELGDAQPTVLVRDAGRTVELRAAADRLGVRPRIQAGLPDLQLPRADVTICTVPAGAADTFEFAQLDTGQTVLDVVYSPWPTPLAATASRHGATVVSGLHMLLHQAGAQVRLMTGRPAPIEAMRAALVASLAERP